MKAFGSKTIKKGIRDIIEIGRTEESRSGRQKAKADSKLTRLEKEKLIAELTKQMKEASRNLEFEQAAFIRDRIKELREENKEWQNQ